ncbi:putative protein BIG GRAIN 1 [Helianthus annuus]|nr:putative protein BIG GRAIN 1 [Helianthus annuus]
MDRGRKEYPSFSSTLLDVISRSIDERDDRKPVMRSRKSIDDGGYKTITDVPLRRKSATGLESSSFYINSSNTRGSSVSRHEAETIYGFTARPRPIRTTTISQYEECNCNYNSNTPEMNTTMYAGSEDQKPKAKMKSRAMKIYGYLKKAGKQPISPGSRLATFFHSLFSTTSTKRSKVPSLYNGGDDEDTVHTKRKPKSASTSSFSHASSRGMETTELKRSVKFYPGGNVIVNEYSQPLGSPLAVKIANNSTAEKNRRLNILKSYKRKLRANASSDLFELDHLTAIGMDRCMQELPLYETTSVEANRAIANGLVV